MVFATHVPALGRYAFLLHGYQPAHPAFAVDVLISGGRVWQGEQPQRRGRAGPRAAALGVSSTPPPPPPCETTRDVAAQLPLAGCE